MLVADKYILELKNVLQKQDRDLFPWQFVEDDFPDVVAGSGFIFIVVIMLAINWHKTITLRSPLPKSFKFINILF